MAKQKFVLTADLVKVEPEPQQEPQPEYQVVHAKTLQPLPKKEEIEDESTTASALITNEAPTLRSSRHTPNDNDSAQRGQGSDHGFYEKSRTFGWTNAPPSQENKTTEQPVILKDQLNLKIDHELKRDFRMWCLSKNIKMTDALEKAIILYMYKKSD